MIEITTASQQEISEAWPNVTYKGDPFFDKFYNALMLQEQILFENVNNKQEVYLGYLKEPDQFIVGWDGGDNECFATIQFFMFTYKLIQVGHKIEFDTGFYPYVYNMLCKQYRDLNLLDLRLD